MSFASKYNKRKLFNVDTTDFEYINTADLVKKDGIGKKYPLTAIYINSKSKYGESPVFATDKCLVNIPSHMTETAKQILEDDEAIQQINDGQVGFKLYEYTKDDKPYIGVEFVDM